MSDDLFVDGQRDPHGLFTRIAHLVVVLGFCRQDLRVVGHPFTLNALMDGWGIPPRYDGVPVLIEPEMPLGRVDVTVPAVLAAADRDGGVAV